MATRVNTHIDDVELKHQIENLLHENIKDSKFNIITNDARVMLDIFSNEFNGMSIIEIHRHVYKALDNAMPFIHSIIIKDRQEEYFKA